MFYYGEYFKTKKCFAGLVTKVSLTEALEIIKYFSDLVIVDYLVWLTWGQASSNTPPGKKKRFKLWLKHHRQEVKKGAERP